jgi:hypothetical protein
VGIRRLGVLMTKKAYRIIKDGDYYVVPAGYVKGTYHNEIRTMNKDRAEEIMHARKTISLKKKYPEVRKGIAEMKSIPLPPRNKQIDWDVQMLKRIPDYITGGKYLLRLRGTYPNNQVATANENHYKHERYLTAILKTFDDRYALYVSEEKVR